MREPNQAQSGNALLQSVASVAHWMHAYASFGYEASVKKLPSSWQSRVKHQEKNAMAIYGVAITAKNYLQRTEVVKTTLAYSKLTLSHVPDSFRALIQFSMAASLDKNAPPIFSDALTLLIRDFMPIYAAYYAYEYANGYAEKLKDNLPFPMTMMVTGLMILLAVAQYGFVLSRKLVMSAHLAVLMMQYPKHYHDMKKDIVLHENEICIECNAMRYTKGEIRSLFLFLFRQMLPELLTLPAFFPAFFHWGASVVAFLLRMQFASLSIAEYRLASEEKLCQRHREVNFAHHSELLLSFGFLLKAAPELLKWTGWLLFKMHGAFFQGTNKNALTSLFISPLLQTVSAVPASVYQSYYEAVLMLFLVGATYYRQFPAPVEKTARYSLDISEQFVNKIFEHIVFEIKSHTSNGKKPSVNTVFTWAREKLQKLIVGSLFELVTRYRDVEVKLDDDFFVIRLREEIEREAAKIKAEKDALVLASQTPFEKNMHHYVKTASTVLVPWRNREELLSDLFFRRLWPNLLNSVDGALKAALDYRLTVTEWIDTLRIVSAFFSNPLISWSSYILSWFVGGIDIAHFFTIEFVMNSGPKSLEDFCLCIQSLEKHGLLSQERANKIKLSVTRLKTNLSMLNRIMREFPPEMVPRILAWMKTSDCERLLSTVRRDIGKVLTIETDRKINAEYEIVRAPSAMPLPGTYLERVAGVSPRPLLTELVRAKKAKAVDEQIAREYSMVNASPESRSPVLQVPDYGAMPTVTTNVRQNRVEPTPQFAHESVHFTAAPDAVHQRSVSPSFMNDGWDDAHLPAKKSEGKKSEGWDDCGAAIEVNVSVRRGPGYVRVNSSFLFPDSPHRSHTVRVDSPAQSQQKPTTGVCRDSASPCFHKLPKSSVVNGGRSPQRAVSDEFVDVAEDFGVKASNESAAGSPRNSEHTARFMSAS